MLKITSTFSGFSVNDMQAARQFYGDVLGFELQDETGGTSIRLPGGGTAWMYAKADHQPASYTMLNLLVDDIDAAYETLAGKGVAFEHYPGSPQDANGIMRGKSHGMGPDIAWFKDPAGNILSILEN